MSAEPRIVVNARLHRALLWLLGLVLVSLVANLVLLVRLGGMYLEVSENREAESSHQRLIGEMQKRQLANNALILLEQERLMKRLKQLAQGD